MKRFRGTHAWILANIFMTDSYLQSFKTLILFDLYCRFWGSHHWCYTHQRSIATTGAPSSICDSCETTRFTYEEGYEHYASVCFLRNGSECIFEVAVNLWTHSTVQSCAATCFSTYWCAGVTYNLDTGSCALLSSYTGPGGENPDIVLARRVALSTFFHQTHITNLFSFWVWNCVWMLELG